MKNGKMSLRGRLLFGLVFATYAFITYWVMWPYKPITFHAPIKIVNDGKTVKPGGILIYEMDYTRNMDSPVTITRMLVNSYQFAMTPTSGSRQMGKRVSRNQIVIPNFAAPGKYRMQWIGAYDVNPLRTITVMQWSEWFEVVK